jgi:hypothetical protein
MVWAWPCIPPGHLRAIVFTDWCHTQQANSSPQVAACGWADEPLNSAGIRLAEQGSKRTSTGWQWRLEWSAWKAAFAEPP